NISKKPLSPSRLLLAATNQHKHKAHPPPSPHPSSIHKPNTNGGIPHRLWLFFSIPFFTLPLTLSHHHHLPNSPQPLSYPLCCESQS
ncbi:unnamed protein product, partial [Prunus brigantina]